MLLKFLRDFIQAYGTREKRHLQQIAQAQLIVPVVITRLNYLVNGFVMIMRFFLFLHPAHQAVDIGDERGFGISLRTPA